MFIVTGGGSGIGRALALVLSERSKRVCIVGRREENLRAVAKASPLIEFICTDVSTSHGRQTLINELRDVNDLQGFIHNAGTIEPISPLLEVTESAFRHSIATNVEASLFLTQACFNQLQEGRVLNIGSGVAYFPVASWSSYCMTKAMLAMLTRCWQLEYPNFACAHVMPGIIDTPMQERVRESTLMEKTKHDFFMKLKHNHQLVTPKTCALFLTWLLLDVDKDRFRSQEWDIYDTAHHSEWLISPHIVPPL